MANFLSKLGAVMVAGQIKTFKQQFDYKEYGGAMFIGVRKPVIKAHGSSDAKAFKNAIRQAKNCHENAIITSIESAMAQITVNEKTEQDASGD